MKSFRRGVIVKGRRLFRIVKHVLLELSHGNNYRDFVRFLVRRHGVNSLPSILWTHCLLNQAQKRTGQIASRRSAEFSNEILLSLARDNDCWH